MLRSILSCAFSFGLHQMLPKRMNLEYWFGFGVAIYE